MTCYVVTLLLVCASIPTRVSAQGNTDHVLLHCSHYNGIFQPVRTRRGYLVGGAARVRSYLQSESGALIINGNFFRKTYVSDRLVIDIEVLKLLKPDVVVLAQNEMNLLPHNLKTIQHEGQISIACSDIAIPNTERMIILERHKIVIFGYSPSNSTSLPLVGIMNVKPEDPVKAIKELMDELTDKEKEYLLVAAGCVGYEFARELALQIDVHVVISGCSERMQWVGDTPPENIRRDSTYPEEIINAHGKKVLLAHSYGSTKFLGRLDVITDYQGQYVSHRADMVYLDRDMEEDLKMLKMIDGIKRFELARTRVFLNGECYESECNLGNLITDAMIHYKVKQYNGDNWTDTPIAIIAAGNIKANVNATTYDNRISTTHLRQIFKPHRQLITCTMEGRSILKLFDEAIRDGDEENGMFLQVSGLYLRYDFKSHTVSDKFKIKMVRCSECKIPVFERLERKKTYQLITTADMMEGKYGHTYFAKTANLVQMENTSTHIALSDYLKDIQFVNIGRNERIRISKRSIAVVLMMSGLCLLPPMMVLLIWFKI